ncbi:VOC family protein [Actinotalea solisilvae]|uniref:VOC family protein n=1 Tax=Actinotalea solisilvae TaxID=2072922 RepID=UPI0018F12D38|nr:VOC family protein [Actinotalea solisilvae]
MLSDHAPMPVLAVTDMDRAKEFYEGTLGFTAEEPFPGALTYTAGGVPIFVYQSSYAGTNRATAISFIVPSDVFDREVADLRSRGVRFETYDMPEVVFHDGVADMDGMRSVWFEDPFGNIINVGTDGS